MPLYSIPDLKQITKIPNDGDNRPIINRIPPQELDAVIVELNNRIDAVVNSPEELITSGWIPVE